jgi:hypothetical protein
MVLEREYRAPHAIDQGIRGEHGEFVAGRAHGRAPEPPFLRAREASRNGNAAPTRLIQAAIEPRVPRQHVRAVPHRTPGAQLLVGKGDAYGCRTLCARHDERPATDQVS